jgi:hypothetical protein
VVVYFRAHFSNHFILSVVLVFCSAGAAVGEPKGVVGDPNPIFYSLPLAFERLPLSPRGAKFWTHANGSPAYFYRDSVIFALPKRNSQPNLDQPPMLRMSFVGGLREAGLNPGVRLPGHVNYYTGARAHWRTNVDQYSSLTYTRLFPCGRSSVSRHTVKTRVRLRCAAPG